MVKATDAVWAEAEAWIEAEFIAEENAWKELERAPSMDSIGTTSCVHMYLSFNLLSDLQGRILLNSRRKTRKKSDNKSAMSLICCTRNKPSERSRMQTWPLLPKTQTSRFFDTPHLHHMILMWQIKLFVVVTLRCSQRLAVL